ncbi:MAG: T9SS type A sorting domain-containing protein, partial [Bacteroidetes bacterium]|nr:T9SS type A sorting domain-containing protein [Bacteroidota bacterium]
NVEACAPCHGELTSFDEKKFFFNGMADHDEDGVAEGLQDEVHGLMDILAELLPHADTVAGYDAHDAVGSTWPRVQREAAYNFEMVYYDHSYGVHNPAFTVGLLKLSIAALKYEMTGPGMITGVRDVPNDQGNQVGVSWTKFGGDGGNAVLENPVKAYGVWRVEQIPGKAISNNKINSSNLKIGDQINDEGKLLTYVAYVPAAKLFEYNAMVPTLFNTVDTDTAWTEFVVSAFNENGNVQWTEPAAGFSVDNLIPGAPKAFAGELGDMKVNLTWEESEDVDFKYFAVYRSTTQGSVPSTPYATTTDLKFVDNSVLSGTTYYYVMSAFDFNGNQSDYTQELPFTITSLEEISGTPTQFSLSQNYPNPFNPTTMIKFGLPEASNVKVTVYDAVGKEVGVLVNEYLNSGYYNYSWNASNMATGVYFYEMKAGNFTQVHKMLLVK